MIDTAARCDTMLLAKFQRVSASEFAIMNAAASSTSAGAVAPRHPPQAVPTWPRAAQLAMVFLLGVALTLLGAHIYRGLRWGSRPTELQRPYQVDLNRAGRAELLQVPGVGVSLAQRIQDYRGERGSFQSVTDLRQVKGVGPTTLERLRPWFSVQPATAHGDGELNTEVTKPKSPTAGKKEIPPGEQIDINQASAVELQRLPGIGPKRAQQIVEERRKSPFASVEQLRRVPGIGPKTMEKLRPHVTVDASVRLVTADGS
jgi:competence protein ComEA